MGVLCRTCSRHRLLVVTSTCSVLFCLTFIRFMDHWAPEQMPYKRQPYRNYSTRIPKDDLDYHFWEKEYESRVQRVRDVCNQNGTPAVKRSRETASNRNLGNITRCSTKVCSIIVDDRNLFCFVPKVASTHIKRFLLNVSHVPLSDALRNDNGAMHIMANDVLKRVSPVYYPPEKLDHFYKIMFVRHPFDRLVSAFRSKAEHPKSKTHHFYSKYWNPIMKKLRPKGSNMDRITFKEFLWYLTHTSTRYYDIHWSPYWSRCDPCYVDYDFIGKLETTQQDFLYAFRQAGIEFNPKWWSDYPTTNRTVTMKYFASIPKATIEKLYSIFRIDFELFGYSADEFLSVNNTAS